MHTIILPSGHVSFAVFRDGQSEFKFEGKSFTMHGRYDKEYPNELFIEDLEVTEKRSGIGTKVVTELLEIGLKLTVIDVLSVESDSPIEDVKAAHLFWHSLIKKKVIDEARDIYGTPIEETLSELLKKAA